MKIRFLDVSTPSLEYEISEGSVITQCKNETLDSATIVINNTQDDLDIEPLDRVVLIDDEGRLPDFYLCVESMNRVDICVVPRIYKYELSLISETKRLEGIKLPNLTITPTSRGLRVRDYISRYIELYGPKVRHNIAGNIRWEDELTIDIDPLKFNMDCPEMQWNTPTLREVLNDLMMVADCIPVVRNNVLSQIDLTEINRDISEDTHINYVQQSKSLDDHVSELRMNMINTVQENQSDINYTVKRVEYIPYTANDGYMLTDQNMVLKTQFPILKINKLYMTFGYQVKNIILPNEFGAQMLYDFLTGMLTRDLCNLNGTNGVFEEREYHTLDRLISDNIISSNISLANYGKYQNFAIYYTRGSNVIQGFSNLTERRLGFITEKYDTNALLKTLILMDEFASHGLAVDLGTGSFQNTYFCIEYETTGDIVFSASKKDYPRNKRVITDNQTNSYVNASLQGFMEYQKANRLGNLMKNINARYDNNYSNIIKISDVYKGSIVYQCQYQIYKNHIDVNAIATKNYVLRDYFTGVKAKIRSWKIVDGSEAQTRHELKKYYCELSHSQFDEVGLPDTNFNMQDALPSINFNIGFAEYFCSSLLTTYTNSPINAVALKFRSRNSVMYPSGNDYVCTIDIMPRVIGNSICFTFKCNDNYGVDKVANLDNNYITFPTDGQIGETRNGFPIIANISGGIGGVPLKDLKYVDDNGENIDVVVILGKEIEKEELNPNQYLQYKRKLQDPSAAWQEGGWDDNDIAAMCRSFYEQNYCSVSDFTEINFYEEVTLHKDNKEVIAFTYEFEFCTSDEDIEIGKSMITRQTAVRMGDREGITISRKSDGTVLGNASNITINELSQGVCQIVLTYNSNVYKGSIIELRESTSNELIFSFKQDTAGTSQTLYLNFLKDRDKRIL